MATSFERFGADRYLFTAPADRPRPSRHILPELLFLDDARPDAPLTRVQKLLLCCMVPPGLLLGAVALQLMAGGLG